MQDKDLEDDFHDAGINEIVVGMQSVGDALGIPDEVLPVCEGDYQKVGYDVVSRRFLLPYSFFSNNFFRPINRIGHRCNDIDDTQDIGISVKPRSKNLYRLHVVCRNYLWAMGAEEMTHYVQIRGHERFSALIPIPWVYNKFSNIEHHLCPFEVEARKFIDNLAENTGRLQIWKDFDQWLLDDEGVILP